MLEGAFEIHDHFQSQSPVPTFALGESMGSGVSIVENYYFFEGQVLLLDLRDDVAHAVDPELHRLFSLIILQRRFLRAALRIKSGEYSCEELVLPSI
jgi:hypothetical protein